MKEYIRQYIEETNRLLHKQAAFISSLEHKTHQLESDVLAKNAAEALLGDLSSRLSEGRYTAESVAEAIRNKDTGCLIKVSGELEEDYNSWGRLEDDSVNSDNIRPSERKLYTRLGLI